MFVGGYQIIDLKEVAIDDVSGANIAGLYDKIESADLKKPILLTGVNNDGTLLGDRFVTFTVSSSIFYAVLDTVYAGGGVTAHVLKVESDDDVSIIVQEYPSQYTPESREIDFSGQTLTTSFSTGVTQKVFDALKDFDTVSQNKIYYVSNAVILNSKLPVFNAQIVKYTGRDDYDFSIRCMDVIGTSLTSVSARYLLIKIASTASASKVRYVDI